MLEREPLNKIAKINQLNAFKHEDFWYCVDSKKEFDFLNENFNKIKKFL